jgi:WD40 repeat protein
MGRRDEPRPGVSGAPEPASDARARRGPYQGLTPYTEDDGVYFFGRDRQRAIVLDNLLAYRLSVLYGPSGVGKSSLLRAGVARHVREQARGRLAAGRAAEHVAVVLGAWSSDPQAGLREAIVEALRQLSPGLGAVPASGSLADVVGACAERLDGSLLLVLDQFEEYFLYNDADGPFVAALADLVARRDGAARVLISIREDALARLDELADDLPGLLDNLARVAHLDPGAARDAITRPLELWSREHAAAGGAFTIEPALVDAILAGVGSPTVDAGEQGGQATGATGRDSGIQAPYLQLVLTRLWDEEQRNGSRVMRLRTFEDLHGVQAIVSAHVETAIAQLSSDQRAIAAAVLRQLVTKSGTKIALAATDLTDHVDADEAALTTVLERLTRDARILQPTGDGKYQIAHDALARPILDWRAGWQREQDRLRERRRSRIVAAVAAGLALTVVAVTALAVLAYVGRRDARREAAEARSLALSSAARDAAPARPDVALLLALGALRVRDREQARDAMLVARQSAGPDAAVGILRRPELDGPVADVAYSPDGRLVVGAGGGAVALWDARTHRSTALLAGAPTTVFTSVAVSPDGRLVAAGTQSGQIRSWELPSRKERAPLPGRHAVLALAFSPDGRTLVSAGEEHVIRLWDVAAQAATGRVLRVPDRRTYDLAFSPDGRELAATGSLYTARVWRLGAGIATARQLRRPAARFISVAFAPDGRTLAAGGRQTWLWRPRSGSARRLPGAAGDGVADVAFGRRGDRVAGAGDDGSVRVWDVRRGGAPTVLPGPRLGLQTVAFDPAGRTIAAGGGDERVWLFDPRRASTIPASGGAILDASFDPGARRLATAGDDGRVRLWDVAARRVGRSLAPLGEGGFQAVEFGPGGTVLAAADASGRIVLWDPRALGRAGAVYHDPSGSTILSIAFGGDDGLLAYGTDDGRAVLWDVARHRPRIQLRHGRDQVSCVALSRDGRMLAAGGDDGTVRLWDVAHPTRPTVVALRSAVGSVAFRPDGHVLAATLDDGRTAIVDVARRHVVFTKAPGGQARPLSAAFSADGRVLLTANVGDPRGAGDGGTIRFWDVAGRRVLGGALALAGAIPNVVAVSPDGHTFAAGLTNGEIALWSHMLWDDGGDRHALRADVCELVGDQLSPREFERYAPGLKPVTVCDR